MVGHNLPLLIEIGPLMYLKISVRQLPFACLTIDNAPVSILGTKEYAIMYIDKNRNATSKMD